VSSQRHPPHDPAHESALDELWASDGATRSPAVTERLNACAGCAEFWRNLEAADASAAHVLSQLRRDAAPRPSGEQAPGEARLEALLAHAIARRQPRPRSWTIWLAAAGVVLAAGFGLRMVSERHSTGQDPELGGALRLVAPARSTDARDHFRFEAADDGGWFVVEVFDAQGAPLLRSARLAASPWTPQPAEVATIPERFRWQVTAYDASGNFEARADLRVER